VLFCKSFSTTNCDIAIIFIRCSIDSKKNSITENSLGAIADNPNLLNLPQLEPDHYAVHYRVMSADGHVIE